MWKAVLLVASLGSALVLSFLTGIVFAYYKPQPYHSIVDALKEVNGIARDWRGALGLRPARFSMFAPPRDFNGQRAMVVGSTEPGGLTLMAGLFDNANALRLVDGAGRPVRTWNIDLFSIFTNLDHIQPDRARARHRWGYDVHGSVAFPDGSVVFNISYSGLVKMDRCGHVIWALPRMTHHSVFVAEDGSLWVPARRYHHAPPERFRAMRRAFYEDTILHMSADGRLIEEISFTEFVFNSKFYALLACPGDERFQGCGFNSEDPTHINDVKIFTADSAQGFAGVQPGDLLVSSRNLNLLVIFDPRTLAVRWSQVGPWRRQHDPQIRADGVISVFNNNRDAVLPLDRKFSNILHVNVNDGKTKTYFPQTTDPIFYSETCGSHQYLRNGNLLITEAEGPVYGGRVFEVDTSGKIVWQYFNWHDDRHLAFVPEAHRYEQDYFRLSDWSCPP